MRGGTSVVAIISLALLRGCIGDCPEFESPCPEPLDLGEMCDQNGGCTTDGAPADCFRSKGCFLEEGQLLSIPVADVADSLPGQDLMLTLANGCDFSDHEAAEFAVALDGVSATPFSLGSRTVFRWDPFPDDPQLLEITYGTPSGTDCADVSLLFLDAVCESENPEPGCSL